MFAVNRFRLLVLTSVCLTPSVLLAQITTPKTDVYGDPLPAHAVMRLGSIRFRHAGEVRLVRYTKDGSRIVSVGSDNMVRLWDAKTGRQILKRFGHYRQMYNGMQNLAISEDGHTLAMGDYNQISLWNLEKGKRIRQFTRNDLQGVPNAGFYSNSFDLSADGGTLIVWGSAGNNKSEVRLFNVKSGGLAQKLESPGDGYLIFAHMSPDGKSVVVVNQSRLGINHNVYMWEKTKGWQTLTIGGAQSRVRMIRWTPNGKTLIAWSDRNQSIYLWDRKTKKEAGPFRSDYLNNLDSFDLSPDGELMVLGGQTKLQIIDRKGKEVRAITVQRKISYGAHVVAFSPDGKHIASGGNNTIQIWDVSNGNELNSIAGHQGNIGAVDINGDGSKVVTVSMDQSMRIWDAQTGKSLATVGGSKADAAAPSYGYGSSVPVSFDPSGKFLIGRWHDGRVYKWDAATGKEAHAFTMPGLRGYLAVSPDGKYVAGTASNGVVVLHHLDSGREIRRFLLYNKQTAANENNMIYSSSASIFQVAFSPDGRTLAAGGSGASTDPNLPAPFRVRLWEIASGHMRVQFRLNNTRSALNNYRPYINGISGQARLLTFSPNGRLLAVEMGSSITLFDVSTGREIRQMGGPHVYPASAVFSPNGRYLASGTLSGAIRVWETATGTLVGEFKGHEGPISSMAFAYNGDFLVSGATDTTAIVWDVRGLLPKSNPNENIVSIKLQSFWQDLADTNGVKAYQAIKAMTRTPGQTLPFLKTQLQPVQAPTPAFIDELIDKLDSKRFVIREKATSALEQLGALALAALERKLASKTLTLESSRRLLRLKEKIESKELTADDLRTKRAIEILEKLGTAESMRLLQSLAQGASHHQITEDAQEAVRRMSRLLKE